MNEAGIKGIFIGGVDTDVGKTYFSARFVRALRRGGAKVGCYKPVASGGGVPFEGRTVPSDALELWDAAGRPGSLEDVCPQAFTGSAAPPLAALWEGKSVDREKIRAGFRFQQERSDFLVVEGAGGILSPLDDQWDNLDWAAEWKLPLVLVAANRVGVVNQVRMAAECIAGRRIPLLAVILNQTQPELDPRVAKWHRDVLQALNVPMILELGWNWTDLEGTIPWVHLHPELRPPE